MSSLFIILINFSSCSISCSLSFSIPLFVCPLKQTGLSIASAPFNGLDIPARHNEEEVGEIIPEVVAYEGNGRDATSIDYGRLTAVLIEAVKEQQEQIETLSKRIEELEETRILGR